jgi:hypothetical protein
MTAWAGFVYLPWSGGMRDRRASDPINWARNPSRYWVPNHSTWWKTMPRSAGRQYRAVGAGPDTGNNAAILGRQPTPISVGP